jgi:SAM-dependent methyltransferase
MRRVQFGCGGNRIPGWENYDWEVDITKPLPFVNNSVDQILAEHVVEHVSIHDAWNFFEECYRILNKNGILRIAVPCVSRIFTLADQDYFDFIAKHGWGSATRKDAVKSIIFNHGHLTIWEKDSLSAILQCMGFAILTDPPEACTNILNHHHVIGEKINNIETIFVDCVKL